MQMRARSDGARNRLTSRALVKNQRSTIPLGPEAETAAAAAAVGVGLGLGIATGNVNPGAAPIFAFVKCDCFPYILRSTYGLSGALMLFCF